MMKDPSPENGDGISCRGRGLELNAYGSMDLTWMDLDDIGSSRKSARFLGTDNGEVILTLELTYPEGEADTTVVNTIMKSFFVP